MKSVRLPLPVGEPGRPKQVPVLRDLRHWDPVCKTPISLGDDFIAQHQPKCVNVKVSEGVLRPSNGSAMFDPRAHESFLVVRVIKARDLANEPELAVLQRF